jgi:hypothetical protein
MDPMPIDSPTAPPRMSLRKSFKKLSQPSDDLDISRMKKMQIFLVVVAVFVFLHLEKDIKAFGEVNNATISTKPPKGHNFPDKYPTVSDALPPETNGNAGTDRPSQTTVAPNPTPPSIPNNSDSTAAPTAIQITATQKPSLVPILSLDSKVSSSESSPDSMDSVSDETPTSSHQTSKTVSSAPTSEKLSTRPPISINDKNLTQQIQGTNPILTSPEEKFPLEKCDLSSLSSWYPSNKDDAWQLRAPYVIIAGVWNSGSQSLARSMYRHPHISKESSKTNGFFLPRNFMKFGNRSPKVFAARQRMYAQVYNIGLLRSSPNVVGMDVSPGYLFYANQVSQSILCVSPWSKIVIILRNPVDRVYAQWAQARQSMGLQIDLEQWVANELHLIQSVGLVGLESGSNEEREAWKKYKNVRSMPNAVGRSLYVLQLEEWLNAYKDAGKNPRQKIYIVPSEVLENESTFQEEYNKIITFLGLSSEGMDVSRLERRASSSAPPMDKEIREKLEKFFKPYNKRLYKLLKAEQFLEYSWEELWTTNQ